MVILKDPNAPESESTSRLGRLWAVTLKVLIVVDVVLLIAAFGLYLTRADTATTPQAEREVQDLMTNPHGAERGK